MLSQILVEFPWMLMVAILSFVTWYYPIGLYRNAEAAGAVTERGGLMFLYLVNFFFFAASFAYLTVVTAETAEAAGNLCNLIFSLSLLFCGVLANSSSLGWWIWMYRVSPFTYFVSGILSTALGGSAVVCSDIEVTTVQPPAGQSCGQYLGTYIELAQANLLNPNSTSDCQMCAFRSTDQFLTTINASYENRWRDYGIEFVYILFNIAAACFLYWLARVPKKTGAKVVEKAEEGVKALNDNPQGTEPSAVGNAGMNSEKPKSP